MAIELDGTNGDEKGRIRLVPIPALLAIDILEAAKAEEEKHAEPSAIAGYFRESTPGTGLLGVPSPIPVISNPGRRLRRPTG